MENKPAAGTASFIRDSTYGAQQDPAQFYDHHVHMQFPVMYSQIPPPPISVTPAYIVGLPPYHTLNQ
ncbi:hypothetical protein AB6A40_009569 [Gnathostoma spinigerum]|uniref:Uncharacterized protein n=1 Tax=Gnathostoma spinigerum TaxID=75299 RepID=A0ABD6F1T3_9BILA